MEWDLAVEDRNLRRKINLEIIILDEELVRVKETCFDRLLYEECHESDKLSDKLLALEHLTRLIEELKKED